MSAQTSDHKTMSVKLIVWRQKGLNEPGRFETYAAKVTEHHSFLEMLDVVNEDLISRGRIRSCSTTTAGRGSAGRAPRS